MRIQVLFAAAILLSGCASTYQQNVVSAPSAKLQRGKAVTIATPINGSYDSTDYPASGRMTAGATRSAFARFSERVSISNQCRDVACLKVETAASDYSVVPEILHWEDRATEWSGRPDRIEIKVTVYDALSPEPLASTIFSGKSKWGTLGGDHPQDLLPEPMNAYVESLY